MNTKSVIPPPVEWDFRTVPDAAIEAATLYEYARTSPTLREAGKAWLAPLRKSLIAALKKGDHAALARIAAAAFKPGLAALRSVELFRLLTEARPDFPRAWLVCPALADREPSHSSVKLEPIPKLAAFVRDFCAGSARRGIHIGETEFLTRGHAKQYALRIEWEGASQKEIVGDFARWLSTEAKHHREMKPRGKGGQVQTEPLKWLAAYRLAAAGLSYPQTYALLELFCDPGSRQQQNAAREAGLDPADVPLPLKGTVHNAKALPLYFDPSGFSAALGHARSLLAKLEKGDGIAQVGF